MKINSVVVVVAAIVPVRFVAVALHLSVDVVLVRRPYDRLYDRLRRRGRTCGPKCMRWASCKSVAAN